ncbi:MAG: pyridoxamine 5'-phosphate oxidase [Sneathiellales bacterium]|nr:pyridoxamine 5'-phosphate oxidase [Sneathiellales bacterium]
MQNTKNYHSIRRDYKKSELNIEQIEKSPFKQFNNWMDDALNSNIADPTAMTVCTVDKHSRPSSRILLLKEFNEKGFVFYTNYKSRKSQDILANPFASYLFFWDDLERQIRIEGKLQKLSFAENDIYFQKRPYESKIGAHASIQSSVLDNRETFDNKVLELKELYPEHVPTPDFWGGYRLIPDYFEFWQGRASRLHDRIIYRLENNQWKIERLYP